MRASLCLLLPVLASTAPAGPNEALAAALKDARALPPGLAPYARYLTAFAVREAERAEFERVLAFHVNSLSREADFGRPVAVAADVYRLDLRDYGWNAGLYDRLADRDPWFHVRLQTEVDETEPWGHYPENDRTKPFVVTEHRKTGHTIVKTVTAAAPWLDAAAIAELARLTGSAAPLLRADWFLFQTAISEGHDPGYYDFLGIKDRAAFEQLVGLDAALSGRLQREARAIVRRSGVALNNRQIVRLQTVTGGYWVTLDSEKSTDRNNAVRLLDDDYRHDAEEVYGVLPNGLFAVGAFAANGVAQKTVPDKIASDGTATGNDRRIHSAKSCIACHVEGIRPIDDYARRVYRGAVKLQAVDYEPLRGLQRKYLGDLDRLVRRDQADYAEALGRVNGLTAADNARAYLRAWDAYAERDVGPADVARELGVPADRLVARLAASAAATGQLDPVLAGLLQRPPEPLRREHFEEAAPLFYLALKGYVAP